MRKVLVLPHAATLLAGLLAFPAVALAAGSQKPDMYVQLSTPRAVAPGAVTSTTLTWGCQANSADAEGRSIVQPRVDAWAPRGTEFDMASLDRSWTAVDKRHVSMQMLVTLICYRPGAAENIVYHATIRLRVLPSATPGTVLHDLKAKITENYGNAGDTSANDTDAAPVRVSGTRPRPTPTASPAATKPAPRPTRPSPSISSSQTPSPAASPATSRPAALVHDESGSGGGAVAAGVAGAVVVATAGASALFARRRGRMRTQA